MTDRDWITGATRYETPWTSDRGGRAVELVVIHWTASPYADTWDGRSNWNRLRRWMEWVGQPKTRGRSSTHVVIGRDGSLAQAAPFSRATWHAGRARFEGRPAVNLRSIGIDLDCVGPIVDGRDCYGGRYYGPTPVDGHEPYTAAALDTLRRVLEHIAQVHPSIAIAGHRDVAVPRGRKPDPGPMLPLSTLQAMLDEVRP